MAKKNVRSNQPKPDNSIEFDYVDEDETIPAVTAVLDNGDFGTREITFETGQLARQAGGSVTTYLDEDTMPPRRPSRARASTSSR